MILPILLVGVGLAFLTIGGEALVRGAVSLARAWGLTPAVIGLTVVAMGTSMPELAVSVMAAASGNPGIAVANVLGSNIFNITVVLGLTALIAAVPVQGATARLEWPFLFAVSCACPVVMLDGEISRIEGAAFIVTLLMFTVYVVNLAKREVSAAEGAGFTAAIDDISRADGGAKKSGTGLALLLLAAGVAALVFGARLLLDGAVTIAQTLGMSERIIGLTVVAAGTGAPELAASVIAARRNQTDVALGNIMGSNVFNILGILGVTALIAPIPVMRASASVDSIWMIATTVLLLPILLRHRRVTRGEGVILLATYIAYLGVLLR